MKLAEMAAILAKGTQIFQGYQLTENTIKTWFDLFNELDGREFYNAFLSALKKPGQTFFPTPGTVQEFLTQKKQLEIDTADEAWAKVCKHAERGCNGVFGGSKAALQAAETLGWDRIQYESFDQLKFTKHEFSRLYERIKEREEIPQLDNSNQKLLGDITNAFRI